MRKTHNYKRKKFKKNVTRKSINRKSKKQTGGMIGNENQLILVGYYRRNSDDSYVGRDSIPIVVSSNYTFYYEYKSSSYRLFGNMITRTNDAFNMITRMLTYQDNFIDELDTYDYSQFRSDSILESIKNKIIFNIYLNRLNLLYNLKNINIYRLHHRGVNIIMNSDNGDTNSIFQYNIDDGPRIYDDKYVEYNKLIALLADYVDLKYYKILFRTQTPKTVEYEPGEHVTYNDTMDFDVNITDNEKLNQMKIEINEKIVNYKILKNDIELLERLYPTLIARVLLETDAELAGEEPREVRQSRASRIMEEGMERIKKNSKASEKNIQQEVPDFPEEEVDF
jgi:hypothetical protein